MESLGYILIYFAKGFLPWQNLNINIKEMKMKTVLNLKRKISIDELCNNLPKEFNSFFNLTKKIRFEDKPNYQNFIDLLMKMIKDKGFNLDWSFDWEKYFKNIKKVKRNTENDLFNLDKNCLFTSRKIQNQKKISKDLFKCEKFDDSDLVNDDSDLEIKMFTSKVKFIKNRN